MMMTGVSRGGFLHLAEHGHAVDLRHLEVDDDDVGATGGEESRASAPSWRAEHHEPFALEDGDGQGADLRLVVGEEDPHRAEAPLRYRVCRCHASIVSGITRRFDNPGARGAQIGWGCAAPPGCRHHGGAPPLASHPHEIIGKRSGYERCEIFRAKST